MTYHAFSDCPPSFSHSKYLQAKIYTVLSVFRFQTGLIQSEAYRPPCTLIIGFPVLVIAMSWSPLRRIAGVPRQDLAYLAARRPLTAGAVQVFCMLAAGPGNPIAQYVALYFELFDPRSGGRGVVRQIR